MKKQTLFQCFFVVLFLSACGKEKNGPGTPENPSKATASDSRPVPNEEVEGLKNDSSWILDDAVDKMTDARKNKLIKIARSEQHIYQITFECDTDGIGVKIETYNANQEGAPMPWEVQAPNVLSMTNEYSRARNFRIRYGDKLANVGMKQSEYSNAGRAVLNSGGEMYAGIAAVSGDKSLRIALARSN